MVNFNCIETDKANPTNFELIFPLLPAQIGIHANEELILNIHGAILPALSLQSLERYWQGAKSPVPASPPEFEQMTVQFIIDQQFRNWKLIYNWMTFIANNKDKMMEEEIDAKVDAHMRIMDNFGTDILAVKIVGVWPTNLQEVSFSAKEGEIQLEGGATFVYDYFTVSEYT